MSPTSRGLLLVGIDVVARLHASGAPASTELQARTAQLRLAEAQRIAKLGSWELDIEPNVLTWSDEVYRIFEIDAQAFGASYDAFLAAVHPDDRAVVDEAFRASLVARAPFELVHRLRMRDGRIKWVHERCETFYEGAGRPLRAVGTVQDVTDRIEAEQAAARNTAAIESTNNAIAFIDLAGTITYANRAFLCMWEGCDRDEVRGRAFTDVLARAGATGFPAEARALVDGWAGEVRTQPVGGRSGVFQVSVWPIQDEAGVARSFSVVLVDLTERVEMQHKLEAQLRETEVLLREVHHRVKNNLQIISSLLHFSSRRSGASGTEFSLEDLRRRLLAMTLVHEQLYHSESLQRVDLADYLSSLVVALVASVGGGRPIAFEPTMRAIELPIERALPVGMIVCELVTNVLKYAFPEGRQGSARVRVERDAAGVTLTIADDGVGLPPGFDVLDGGAFGFRLVRSLVAQLEGTLEISSPRGVRTVIRFPMPEASSMPEPPPLHGPRWPLSGERT